MKVDADYVAKPYEEWRGADWPKTYQAVDHPNLFAVGTRVRAAAPDLAAAQEPSWHGHRALAATHRDAVGGDGQDRRADHRRPDEARWLPPGARGVDGEHGRRVRGLGRGRYATRIGGRDEDDSGRTGLTVYPTGRDLADTRGEIGLSGHWATLMLHYLFIHKAKGRLGWQLIWE
jgi:sulfide:quinone oxidoreductase